MKSYVGKGKNKKNKKDRPYTYFEISKMLEKADQRGRIAILLMSSAGIRVGRGKPIVNDPGATKDLNTGKWICSSCQEESLNKMFLRTLGPNHPKCQAFIAAEDRKVRKHNDAARRLNEHSKQYLMRYKRNRYTGHMPLSTHPS